MMIWAVRPWLVVVLLLAAGVWQWYRYATGQTMISDAELTGIFLQNRSTLERLLQMAAEDDLEGRIGLGYVDDNTLMPARVEEYRSFMRQTGVELFVVYPGPGPATASFWVDLQGSVIGGRRKGITFFSQQPRDPVLPSLDRSCKPSAGPVCSGVRHIEDNWWLLRAEDS